MEPPGPGGDRRPLIFAPIRLDSTHWDHLALSPDDIVISTSLKTSRMQRIVSLLLSGPGDLPGTLWMLSPRIDARFHGTAEEQAELVAGPDPPLPRWLANGGAGRNVASRNWGVATTLTARRT